LEKALDFCNRLLKLCDELLGMAGLARKKHFEKFVKIALQNLR
jgi:hypothetical protein